MASVTKVGARWRVQIRRKGQPSLSQYFTSHAEAQKWARSKEVELDQGKRFGSGLGITLGGVVRAYRSSLKKAHGTTKKWNLDLIENSIGHLRLDEVTGPTVTHFLNRRAREGVGPSTNGQTLSYIRTVIRYGSPLLDAGESGALALARMDMLWDTMMHTGQVSHSAQRSRRPTDEELVALFDYFDCRPRSNTPMTDICMYAVCTAMRLGEIVGSGGVVWEDFSHNRRTQWVRARKDPTVPGGRDMEVPLPQDIVVIGGRSIDPVEVMMRQKTARRRAGRIFPHAENTVSLAFSKACDELKIGDLTFHDLRHDAISRLFEHDWTIPKVAAVSGHKSWKNLQRYTHLRPSQVEREG